MNTKPAPFDATRPATKDVLRDIAVRIKTLEGALKLLRESRDVDAYDPIPPFK